MNCLTEALAVAKAQSALALELRSTITLARMIAEGGQRDHARHELALVYGRFTEGFETADLGSRANLWRNWRSTLRCLLGEGISYTWAAFSLLYKRQRA